MLRVGLRRWCANKVSGAWYNWKMIAQRISAAKQRRVWYTFLVRESQWAKPAAMAIARWRYGYYTHSLEWRLRNQRRFGLVYVNGDAVLKERTRRGRIGFSSPPVPFPLPSERAFEAKVVLHTL